MNRNEFENFTQQLVDRLASDSRVLGVVAFGSMADLTRMDRWSDHDFSVITVPGVQEDFRQNTAWLPAAERIVLQVRETEHGLKILYEDGHLLEFAIFDAEELFLAKANDYAVLLDKADIAARMARVQQASVPAPRDLRRDFLMFLGLLQVGSGRCARGEVLSGHVFIKSYALGHLLPVLVAYVPPRPGAKLDNLDVYRRFEFAFPELGSAINTILLQDPISAARELLSLAEDYLRERMPDFPQAAVHTLHEHLARATSNDDQVRD